MECAPSQYIFEKMSGRLDSGLLTEDGKFTRDFPEGFFDATLAELLEME